MNSGNWTWHCTLYLFVTLLVRACSSNSYTYAGEPIPLSRCERNIPVYHIIPAALLPSGTIVPIQSLSPAVLPTVKRIPRQRQSSVVQQVVVNQNANQQTIPISIGDFDSGFGDGFDGGHRPFFGRPSFGRGHRFGHSFARTYGESEGSSTANQIPAPPCPNSYIISCQPRLAPAPCSNAGSGGGASGASY